MKRILCVCNSGNVRSVTLARLLKKSGHEVLACGVDKSFRADTVRILANWADVIFAQKDSLHMLRQHLYNELFDKIDTDSKVLESKIDLRFDIGPDDWKIPDHPDLLRRMRDMVRADPEWS